MSEPSVRPKQFQVAANKATHYLLDEAHGQGGSKARFLMRFGFTRSDPITLLYALLEHPTKGRFVREALTPLGETKLMYEGPLASPDGRSPEVRTVWRILPDAIAEFVSMVPVKRR